MTPQHGNSDCLLQFYKLADKHRLLILMGDQEY